MFIHTYIQVLYTQIFMFYTHIYTCFIHTRITNKAMTCMYACMYIYRYIHVNTHTYYSQSGDRQTDKNWLYISKPQVCACAQEQVHTFIHIHTQIHTRMQVPICLRFTYKRAYMHTNTCTHIRAYHRDLTVGRTHIIYTYRHTYSAYTCVYITIHTYSAYTCVYITIHAYSAYSCVYMHPYITFTLYTRTCIHTRTCHEHTQIDTLTLPTYIHLHP
jgi:hypothetical protein